MGWGTAIQAVGTAIGIASSIKGSSDAEKQAERQAEATEKAAKENAEISLYDASVAKEIAEQRKASYQDRLWQHMQFTNQYIGALETAVAKAGVAMSGSAKRVVIKSGINLARDAEKIIFEGKNAVDAAKSSAKRYKKLAKAGLRDAAATAALIETAGANTSSAIRWQGAASALSNIYTIGQNEGWWKTG